jgi:signal transduction histidine kinase
VRIIVVNDSVPDGAERRLADKMEEWGVDVIEKDEDAAAMSATAVYALKHEDKLTGLLAIAAEPRTLTSEKRAVLDVLAGQVAIEIESLRLIEEKLQLERDLANQEHLARLGQMATTIAHEVKNPLSSIKSIAQVMREEDQLKEYDRDLQLIVTEIDRLSRTVSQLLAFARPSRAETRTVQLSEMVNSIIALFNNEAKDRGVRLDAEIETEYVLAGAQAAALREAVSNLVLNAVQATDDGGKVSVRARVEEALNGHKANLVLSVTDTGSGISEEEQRRVFEPFYTTKSRGTGLGLAIVQRRIVEMGGVVELTSPVENHRGSRFRLVVPLAAPVESVS